MRRQATVNSSSKYSVENKPLKAYSAKAQMEGTAPTGQTEAAPVQTAANTGAPANGTPVKTSSNPFLSPLDEMNNAPAEQPAKETPKKGTKKPAKVAKNNGK